MERELKYVSPEYQAQLDKLAETLVTTRRFGQLVLFASEMGNTTVRASWLDDTVEIPVITDQMKIDYGDGHIFRGEE